MTESSSIWTRTLSIFPPLLGVVGGVLEADTPGVDCEWGILFKELPSELEMSVWSFSTGDIVYAYIMINFKVTKTEIIHET